MEACQSQTKPAIACHSFRAARNKPFPPIRRPWIPPPGHSCQAYTPNPASHPCPPFFTWIAASSTFTCLREANAPTLRFKMSTRIFKMALENEVHNTKSFLGTKSRNNGVVSMYPLFTTWIYDSKTEILNMSNCQCAQADPFMSTSNLSCIYM